jgi:hypothetical protein
MSQLTVNLVAGIEATAISYLGELRALLMILQSLWRGTFHEAEDLSNCSMLDKNWLPESPEIWFKGVVKSRNGHGIYLFQIVLAIDSI